MSDTIENSTSPKPVDSKLLEILVCPVTRSSLRYDAKAQELISDKAKLAFPIKNGIPILIASQAREID